MDHEAIKKAAEALAAQLSFDATTGGFAPKDAKAAETLLLEATGVTADDLKKARAAVTNSVAITTRALAAVAPAQYEQNKELTQVSAEVQFGGYNISAAANTAGHAPGQDATVTTIRLGVTGQYSSGAEVVHAAKNDMREALSAYSGRGK